MTPLPLTSIGTTDLELLTHLEGTGRGGTGSFNVREFVLNYRHPAPRREETRAGSAGQVAFPLDPVDPLDPVLNSQIEALLP